LDFQRVLTWFDKDTCGDNNNVAVGGIRTYKLVLHSSRYPILCKNLLAPKIGWNNVAMLVFEHVHGVEA